MTEKIKHRRCFQNVYKRFIQRVHMKVNLKKQDASSKKEVDISIVIPCYNEEDNILPLYKRLKEVLDTQCIYGEIVCIDDGSKDRTFLRLLEAKKLDTRVKIIKFKKNFGQTAAWDAGFKSAKGRIIVVMDADLQNDPADIPRLLEKLEEGYDVVSGWRYERKDNLSKIIFSWFSNKIRKKLTGEKIHDSGCALKAYRKECLNDLNLFGETHRFITAILSWKGYRVGEVKVKHYHRKYGKTKYSTSRLFKGMMDILVVVFWQRFSSRPLYLFGFFGLIFSGLGTLAGVYSVYLKFFNSIDLSRTFLPSAAIILTLLGVNLFVSGIIADICIKDYYKDKQTYLIEKIVE